MNFEKFRPRMHQLWYVFKTQCVYYNKYNINDIYSFLRALLGKVPVLSSVELA